MSGNSQQRKKFNDAVERMAERVAARVGSTSPPSRPEPQRRSTKRFKWSDFFKADIVTQLAIGVFFALGCTMLSINHLIAAEIFFSIAAVLLLGRVVIWSLGFDRGFRAKPCVVGLVFWLILCGPLASYLHLQDKPAFLIVFPLSYDRPSRRQCFYLRPASKPLTNVELTLLDQNAALALGMNASEAMMQKFFPVVSQNYIGAALCWDKPVQVAPFQKDTDSYLILTASSDQAETYSEDLDIARLPNGRELHSIKVQELRKEKRRTVFICADSLNSDDQQASKMSRCPM